MAKSSDLRIYTLPEVWALPLVAAWRTFEKTINPAFKFVLYCVNCGEANAEIVRSRKAKDAIIGIQCQADDCGQTIKFEVPIDPEAEDFPARLESFPPSALKSKHTKEKQSINEDLAAMVLDLFEVEA